MKSGQLVGRPPALGHVTTGEVERPVTIGPVRDPAGGIEATELDDAIRLHLDELRAAHENEKLTTPMLTKALRAMTEALKEIEGKAKDQPGHGLYRPMLKVRGLTAIAVQVQKAAALSMKRFDQAVRLRVHLHERDRAEQPRDLSVLSDAELRRLVAEVKGEE